MEEYQNALSDMSNEAVEYVRGIPVVKTFGQTIFRLNDSKELLTIMKSGLSHTQRLCGFL